MRYIASAISNTGLVRAQNEDNLLFCKQILPEQHGSLSSPLRYEAACASGVLMGVFDGMGGHAFGEKASYLAAKVACETDQEGASADARQLLSRICEDANRIISAEDKSEGRKMGTTAAMLHIQGDAFTVCNVGDSPIYLLRDGVLKMLSEEHTERASYEAIFKKKAEPGRKFPLTQCLGGGMDDLHIEPHFAQGKSMAGDVFLLCSDGLSDLLQEDELREVLGSDVDTQDIVRELEKRALEKGGKDNLTAVCVRILPKKFPPKSLKTTAAAFALLAALIAAGYICGQLLSLLL